MARLGRGRREWLEQTRADLDELRAFLSALPAQLAQARRVNPNNPRLCEDMLGDVHADAEDQARTLSRILGRLPELEEMLQRAETATTLAAQERRLAELEQRVEHLENPTITPLRRKAP